MPTENDSLSRRRFVSLACTAAACATCLGQGPATTPAAATSPSGRLDAGVAADLPEGLTDTFAASDLVILGREGNRLFAMSAACTHQGYTVAKAKDDPAQLRCPKHGCRFDKQGLNIRGPGQGQLARHGVSLKDGHLWVDTNKLFLPGDFEEKGSFVEL